jgi:hypothetical protein
MFGRTDELNQQVVVDKLFALLYLPDVGLGAPELFGGSF